MNPTLSLFRHVRSAVTNRLHMLGQSSTFDGTRQATLESAIVALMATKISAGMFIYNLPFLAWAAGVMAALEAMIFAYNLGKNQFRAHEVKPLTFSMGPIFVSALLVTATIPERWPERMACMVNAGIEEAARPEKVTVKIGSQTMEVTCKRI